jgi:hypothetical protein
VKDKKLKKKAEYISQRKYAQTRNVHLKSVQDAIKSGRLSKSLVKVGNTNKIIPEIADQEWASNTNHDRRPNNAAGNVNANDYAQAKKTKKKLEELPKTFEGLKELISFEGIAPDIADSRAFFEGYKAKLIELEFKEKKRELIPASEIGEAWDDMLNSFQSKLRSLPNKLTPSLAATTKEPEIESILADAIDEVLKELSEMKL